MKRSAFVAERDSESILDTMPLVIPSPRMMYVRKQLGIIGVRIIENLISEDRLPESQRILMNQEPAGHC
ncbi:MAG: hypothetical protein AAGA35_03055 [Patescibacteria group bacterium]